MYNSLSKSLGYDLLTVNEKKRDLYLRQKELLATLLEHGAIS